MTPGSVPGRVIGPGSGSGPPAPRLSPRLRVGSDLRASPIICASVHVSSQNAHLTAINLGGNMSQSETFLTKPQMVKYDVANIFQNLPTASRKICFRHICHSINTKRNQYSDWPHLVVRARSDQSAISILSPRPMATELTGLSD